MRDTLRKKLRSARGQKTGLYYATHYHLVPLYVLCGILIVATLVMGCFMRYMWTRQDTVDWDKLGMASIQSIEQNYLSAVTDPADKKQYIYPVSLRLTTTDPYVRIRYSYAPGNSNSSNAASIGVTTSEILMLTENPLRNLGQTGANAITTAQQCSKLYVIRLQPGATQYGGFSPFDQVKLKDGRTAYIHKNTNCLGTLSDGNELIGHLETALRTVESY